MYQTAYVVCTRERLSRKVSYFRPEKATKSAKIALSHRATYVVSLLSKKHYLPWKILTFKMIQLPKKKINWKINRELLSVITLLINVRDLFFDLKVFAAVESFWKKPKKTMLNFTIIYTYIRLHHVVWHPLCMAHSYQKRRTYSFFLCGHRS